MCEGEVTSAISTVSESQLLRRKEARMDVVSSGLASPRGGREGGGRQCSVLRSQVESESGESRSSEVRVGSRRGSERGDGVCRRLLRRRPRPSLVLCSDGCGYVDGGLLNSWLQFLYEVRMG